MIQAGKNIKSAADELVPVKIEKLYDAIRTPKVEIEARIKQLRIIRTLDERKYREAKSELPYFVCGTFSPSIRKRENFAYTEYFVVDIDHISGSGLHLFPVRTMIENDPRTVMAFVSPGEDGLKVIFRLKDKCYDCGKYSHFYKKFTKELGEKYQISEIIDTKTSDVTRACFISIDKEAYFNPDAVRIDIEQYLEDDLSLIENVLVAEEKKEVGPSPQSLEDEILLKIKETLKMKTREATSSNVFVPQELERILPDVRRGLAENGLDLYEVSDIQYGKRIKLQVGLKKAEINIFYGKCGFRAVAVPKKGTSIELNALVVQLTQSLLDTLTR